MATEKLQIQIDADWRGRSSVKQANDDIDKLDDGVTKTSAGFSSFADAMAVVATAVVAVGAAAKVAWETLGEGAALIRSREQFDSLTESIGSTADVMLGKLKEATGGLVSDAQLIDSAGQIISLGLGKTEGAVVRLANLVTQLGWDMQQVILTFANNSKARLDSLGLSIEDVEANMVALEAQGYSTDAAFDLAVIQAGEEKLALLGSAADSTVGDIARMQTAWENAVDAFSIGFAQGASDEIKLLADNVTIATRTFEEAGAAGGGALAKGALALFGRKIALEELDRALKMGIITQKEYVTQMALLQRAVGGAGEVLAFIAPRQEHWNYTVDASVSGLGALVAIASSADNVLLQYGNAALAAAGATNTLNVAVSGLSFRPSRDLPKVLSLTQDQLDAGAKWREENEKAIPVMTGYSSAATEAKFAASGLLGVMNRTNPVVEDLVGGFGGVGVAAETAADKVARLAAETGSFFDQARRGDDFDPAEAFYSAALASGASAQQLQQLLVTTGLETPERAQEIANESVQRQLASQLGTAVGAGEDIDALWQGVQRGVADPQFAQQAVSQISNSNNVSVTVIINGNITGEELDMFVDNAQAEAESQQGNTAGGNG